MNLLILSWSYVKTKPLNTVLNIVLLSLGIAIITMLLLLGKQLEDALTRNSQGIDLVVGAKGSPMQIILSSVYHIDYPTGNISLDEARQLTRNRLVRQAIPLALGDSYQGFRIVGSNHSYLHLYKAALASGKLWQNKMETVLGAAAARQLQLDIGDTFYGGHGMVAEAVQVHEEQAYQVVGILEEDHSVIDNLILTSVESVWAVHDTHAATEAANHMEEAPPQADSSRVATQGLPESNSSQEITSLLLQYRSPMAAIQLPRYINKNTNMQAASPPFEVARLFSLFGVGIDMIQGLAYLIIFIAGLSIFIALYNALKERQYDLAIMRSLGASRTKLLTHVLLEGLMITAAGSMLGLLLGHAGMVLLGNYLAEPGQIGIDPYATVTAEIYVFLASLGIGVAAALLPALQAYRTDISQVLARA